MACECDFCSGRKKREDNWCAYCGEVKLAPQWWEDLDVCDECDAKIRSLPLPADPTVITEDI